MARSRRVGAGSKRKERQPPPQRAPLSETSGAAKKRAKKAAAAAAANPIGLSELVEAALVMFAERGQRSFYRSMLRKQVETIDKAKRSFKDREQWREVLSQLEKEGKLSYDAAGDNVALMP